MTGLVDSLNFAQKVARSLELIRFARQTHGNRFVVAHSLGKDSCVLWHLVKTVAPDARGFIITTKHKPPETVEFMLATVALYPELNIYSSSEAASIPDNLWLIDPEACCAALKVRPVEQALSDLGATCWATGLRCTEGQTRTDLQEFEASKSPAKLNPILIWHEREIWQYIALHHLAVNPLYKDGYRSLGCAPCSSNTAAGSERAGRWAGTSKCGGECGIHTAIK